MASSLETAIVGTVKIDPMKLSGPWAEAWVLERQHTLSADFLGHDSFGNPQFHTQRSELGELVFRLKNRNDRNTLAPIADTAVQFIRGWNPTVDAIVPVPPSRKRTYQPVIEIAKAIGERLATPVNETAVTKIRDTPELKDVFDYGERIKLLEGAFLSHRVVAGRPSQPRVSRPRLVDASDVAKSQILAAAERLLQFETRSQVHAHDVSAIRKICAGQAPAGV